MKSVFGGLLELYQLMPFSNYPLYNEEKSAVACHIKLGMVSFGCHCDNLCCTSTMRGEDTYSNGSVHHLQSSEGKTPSNG